MAEQGKALSKEEMTLVMKEVVLSVVQGKEFNHNEAGEWVQTIVKKVTDSLGEKKTRFKYVVHCTVSQRGSCGQQAFTSCLWDPKTDGVTSYKYETQAMTCSLLVFALAL
eukprot:TRINITY_DN9978_c0_g1_i1.p1 TRINITY_DN9978_c0_g1~~TRINITY_DN9978_c0_g1_i1.p1  ORF type:complete len:110 (+),score=30.52 TRINITY_DN9978_c0_g1_i1:170-499(+)